MSRQGGTVAVIVGVVILGWMLTPVAVVAVGAGYVIHKFRQSKKDE